MEPFSLTTKRLVLDQPTIRDIDNIVLYCTEPVFKEFMTTPWPYQRQHAESFVSRFVPHGWSSGTEWTWAIRGRDSQDMIGAISIRTGSGMVGYWLGRRHRGRGVMTEALRAVIDAVFDRSDRQHVRWECVVGNVASLRVAKSVGFRFTGEQLGIIPGRDGDLTPSWTGILSRVHDRTPQLGWPI